MTAFSCFFTPYEVRYMPIQYYLSQLKSMLYVAPVVLLAIISHEYAHGWMSDRLGDPTPRSRGRLTLNPLKHLDPIGTLCLLFFHVGWAKPVPIDPWHYKNRKKGIICVALAGPVANILLAFFSVFALGVLLKVSGMTSVWQWILAQLLYYSAVVNVGLALFNLIPVPPLDGSRVLGELSSKVTEWYWRLQKYWQIILLLLLVTGVLSRPLSFLNGKVIAGMWQVVCLILFPGNSSVVNMI